MPLDNKDRDEIDARIQLQTQAYMQSLVEKHLPRIINVALRAHESNIDAHVKQLAVHSSTCPTNRRLNRLLYVGIGVAFGTGIGGGLGLSQLLSLAL